MIAGVGSWSSTAPPQERQGEGGEAALSTSMVRLTAKALMYLVLAPADPTMPSHTPLRRAAIDLIGRGFTLWEPHLEVRPGTWCVLTLVQVSKVLLGLLDMSSEADRWVPSQRYGLPLTPIADCCRTARHALGAIARARPGVFVTSVAKEIARCVHSSPPHSPCPGTILSPPMLRHLM